MNISRVVERYTNVFIYQVLFGIDAIRINKDKKDT